jgi:sugar lactone lactonase YvrE
VSEIGLTAGTVVRRIPTVVTPRGLYITPDGARMYVAGYADDMAKALYAIPPTRTLLDGDGGRATTHLGDIAKD